MDFWSELPKLAEAPVVALLAIVVLALAWTLTRVLAFLPSVPGVIAETMRQAGERSTEAFRRTIDELEATIRDLQHDLHEERLRVDEANAEILGMKRHLLSVDQDRRRALQERDAWKDKARDLEALVQSLEGKVEQLSERVRDLTGRLSA